MSRAQRFGERFGEAPLSISLLAGTGSFTTSRNSTRRLSARPCSLLLLAMGRVGPAAEAYD